MSNVEMLRQNWLKRTRFQPVAPYPRFTEEGLVLGADTRLASAPPDLADFESQQRILALLSAAYGKAISPDVLVNLRRAARAWTKGDKSLAAILIAHAGLPKLAAGDDGCYRLFMADGLLKGGLDPRTLLKTWNIGTDSLDHLAKFNGNHDNKGRFAANPGGSSGEKKPWQRYPNPEMRQKLAEMESNADKPNDGYGVARASNSALGRYQLMRVALQDAGWKNADGSWSDKAKAAGVQSDGDFLGNPEAQEQALTDVMRRNTEQLTANRAYARIGSTIVDEQGNAIPITEAGLQAAAQKEGAGAVGQYLNGTLQSSDLGEKQKRNIEGRLRNASQTPYDASATAAQASRPARGTTR